MDDYKIKTQRGLRIRKYLGRLGIAVLVLGGLTLMIYNYMC